ERLMMRAGGGGVGGGLAGGGALRGPRGGWAQSVGGGFDSGSNGLNISRADPVMPLPLYHERADAVGGFYTAFEFIMFKTSFPLGQQNVAFRGFIDVDGSVIRDINGILLPGGQILVPG